MEHRQTHLVEGRDVVHRDNVPHVAAEAEVDHWTVSLCVFVRR